ncbi:MAG TPA: hypothetical protein VF715_19505 [Thermoleophilaceae bacterium]|jgi:hypothetical protein
MRKLIALALIAGGVAAALKKRSQSAESDSGGSTPSPAPSGGATAASAETSATAPPDEKSSDQGGDPQAADQGGDAPGTDQPSEVQGASPQDTEDLQQVRAGQTEATIEAPIAGVGGDEEAVIPDVSADDPLVREQEAAAAAAAGAVGGEADTVTADVDPEMRPVYEGSGGEPETFETTEEQGR